MSDLSHPCLGSAAGAGIPVLRHAIQASRPQPVATSLTNRRNEESDFSSDVCMFILDCNKLPSTKTKHSRASERDVKNVVGGEKEKLLQLRTEVDDSLGCTVRRENPNPIKSEVEMQTHPDAPVGILRTGTNSILTNRTSSN